MSLTTFKPEGVSIYFPSTNNSPSPKLFVLLSTNFNAEAAKSLPFVKLKFNEPATELLGFIVIISLLLACPEILTKTPLIESSLPL